jgi:hypothetical protein
VVRPPHVFDQSRTTSGGERQCGPGLWAATGPHELRNCGDTVSQAHQSPEWDSFWMVGFYEKVINVKADVVAVLVSATQWFGSGREHCQGRPAGRSI